MLKKFRIQNFKCYSKAQDFELGLINFVYGNNSVGKSTFLQAVEKIVRSQKDNGVVPRDEVTSFKGQGIFEKDYWLMRVAMPFQVGLDEMVLKLVKVDGDKGWHFVLERTNEEITLSQFAQYLPKDCIHVEAGEMEDLKGLDTLEEELTQEQISCVNKMFYELKVGYRCDNARELYDTVLDYGPLAVGDVGAGIRRIFKCAKSLAKWEGGILLLEEPETNVNEDQLAALTKVIVHRALELKRQKVDAQIVVECHSEHMLLKLLMLIKHDNIGVDDVKIVYVEKSEDGSHVIQCELRDGGKIVKWPHKDGFFEARDRILFGGV